MTNDQAPMTDKRLGTYHPQTCGTPTQTTLPASGSRNCRGHFRKDSSLLCEYVPIPRLPHPISVRPFALARPPRQIMSTCRRFCRIEARITKWRPIIVRAMLNHQMQHRRQQTFQNLVAILQCCSIEAASAGGGTMDDLPAQHIDPIERKREKIPPPFLEEKGRRFVVMAAVARAACGRTSRRKRVSAGLREGRRFFDLKRDSVEGQLEILRPVGRQCVFFADLHQGMCRALTENWSRDWKQAATPWGTLEGVQLWRCGGAVYCVGDESLEGKQIV